MVTTHHEDPLVDGPQQLADRVSALRVTRNSDEEITRARLTVCGRARTAHDAAELLFALGIHPRSKRPRSKTQGYQIGGRPPDPQRPKLPPTERPNCGTEGGYSAHHYHLEEPCDRCRVGHREYARSRNEKA